TPRSSGGAETRSGWRSRRATTSSSRWPTSSRPCAPSGARWPCAELLLGRVEDPAIALGLRLRPGGAVVLKADLAADVDRPGPDRGVSLRLRRIEAEIGQA